MHVRMSPQKPAFPKQPSGQHRIAAGAHLRVRLPGALFCFNDDIAVSACRALQERGYRIPEDVLIAGCDGSEEGGYACPALTTIVQPIDRTCSLAWEFLANRLQNAGVPEQHVAVDADLAIRASSIRAPPK